jgi:long-chain acyl-CoA synthetase
MEIIFDAFLRNAAADPGRPVFVHGDRQLTFGALERRSSLVAAGLARAGVVAGMPVGILVTQGLNFPIALLSLWRLGAIVVPFDPGAPPEDRAARESIAELAFMIADAKLSLALTTTRVLQIAELESNTALRARPAPSPGDDALFAFTSGTTGRPKALVHTHASLSAWVHRSIEIGGNVIRDDVVLATIPLQLAMGVANLVFAPLVAGATVVLVQPFTPRIALRTALQQRATCVVTVPAIVKLLADLPDAMGRPAFRRINVSSAALEGAIYDRFSARYGVRPVRIYGMSELGPIASTVGRGEEAYRPIVGWPLVELHLLDDDGGEVREGEAGEIAVRSDSLCRPYCLIEGSVREPLPMKDGLFLTGDIGRLDPDGALVLVERKKAFINGPRLRVDPREVEEVLLRMPGVHDAAVVPTPGRHGYEDIHAYVVAEGNVDENGVPCSAARTLCPANARKSSTSSTSSRAMRREKWRSGGCRASRAELAISGAPLEAPNTGRRR